MDERALNVLKKIQKMLKDKTSAEVTDIELSYIAGNVDTLVELFDEEPGAEPRKPGWRGLIG